MCVRSKKGVLEPLSWVTSTVSSMTWMLGTEPGCSGSRHSSAEPSLQPQFPSVTFVEVLSVARCWGLCCYRAPVDPNSTAREHC